MRIQKARLQRPRGRTHSDRRRCEVLTYAVCISVVRHSLQHFVCLRWYVRTLKDIDVSTDEKNRILDLFTTVLNDLAVRVCIESNTDLDEDSAVEAFMKELRSKPSLHFV